MKIKNKSTLNGMDIIELDFFRLFIWESKVRVWEPFYCLIWKLAKNKKKDLNCKFNKLLITKIK